MYHIKRSDFQMYLKLKNVERTFNVEAPTERSAKGADTNFWVISFSVKEPLTTEEIEEYFTPDNTIEMAFVTPLPNGTEYEYVASGYVNRVFNLIKHLENGECVVEMQLSKNASENATI
jgi:hypothetical protein